MINYDVRAWVRVTFSFHGTVLPRIAARLVFFTLITAIIWLIREFVPGATEYFKSFKPLGHTLVGVAMGLLLVFRNNCSYDRYWEGRKLWGGLVNSSRNLVRGAAVYAGDATELAKLMSAYVLAVKQHLRNNRDLTEIQSLVSPAVYEQACAAGNPPTILAYHMSLWIQARVQNGTIDTVTAQSLESQLRTIVDYQGGCERIKLTPIPFVYAVHIKQLLELYLITLPVILVSELGWFSIPIVAVVAFGLLGIEEAGVEIEDPFGDDPNDLPIEAICGTISRDSTALAEAGKR